MQSGRSCSSEVGEAATQTEPPRVDASIQAEPLEDAPPLLPPASARPANNRQHQQAASRPLGSRPATTASAAVAPATPTAARPASKAGSSRPATQSRAKPATATSSAAGAHASGARRQQSQPVQPPIAAEAFAEAGGQPGVLFVDNSRAWQQYQESSQLQRQQQGSECTPMVYSYNPDPRLRAWQSLEHARLHHLGLSSKLSRRYNVQRSAQFVPVGLHMRTLQPGGQAVRAALLPPLAEEFSSSSPKKNDVAPFLTSQKPTCGYYFSRDTENRKIKHGLAPADLPSWGVDLLDRR